MINFFKKQTTQDVVKLFKIVTVEDSERFNDLLFLNALSDFFKKNFNVRSDIYALGNGYSKDFKSFSNLIKYIELNNTRLYGLTICLGESVRLHYSNNIENKLIKNEFDVQELILSIGSNEKSLELLQTFSNLMYNVFDFQNGYIITIPSNYSDVSERPMRKSLFTVSVENTKNDNLQYQKLLYIKDGFFKNITSINFLSKEFYQKTKIKDIISANGELIDVGQYFIWKIEKHKLESIIRQCSTSIL